VKDSRPPEKNPLQKEFKNPSIQKQKTVQQSRIKMVIFPQQVCSISLSKKSNPTTGKWHSNDNIQDATTN